MDGGELRVAVRLAGRVAAHRERAERGAEEEVQGGDRRLGLPGEGCGRRVAAEDERRAVRGEVARERGDDAGRDAGLLLDEGRGEAGGESWRSRRGPLVRASRNAASASFSSRRTCARPRAKAASVPGAIGTYRSASAALAAAGRLDLDHLDPLGGRAAAALGAQAREEAGRPGVGQDGRSEGDDAARLREVDAERERRLDAYSRTGARFSAVVAHPQ